MVVDYKSRKNEVLASYNTVEELVTELKNYAQSIGLPDPAANIVNLLADIRSKAKKVKLDKFSIMIAGESKSGKSTFINAYLGVDLLPMDVKQCTSAIIEIKYGEKFSVRATYADGRQITINGDEEAREFLKKNAALDDAYRGIPVPTINSEILVKSGKKGKHFSISRAVDKMLKSPEVKAANIYNLPNYEQKIRDYVEAKKDSWQDIVTKIEVMFPFDEELRGVEIVDSPGICACGGVSNITSQYIKNADAIIFLKPISGQALESTQFNQFMKDASVKRNKNALFLVLTRATNVNEYELRRLEEEAYKQFSNLNKENILIVDSKAELYVKKFSQVDDVDDEFSKLKESGNLDAFVAQEYYENKCLSRFSESSKFIDKLEEKARFKQVYDTLNIFGRKAHYILLASLLDSINNIYAKLWNDMNSRIELFREKAEDPKKLAKKVDKVTNELKVIKNKMLKGMHEIPRRFQGDEGIISRRINAAAADFLVSANNIGSNPSIDVFAQLEELSLNKIDEFKQLTEEIQHQVVVEFDKELLSLSDKSLIPFESLKPDFTEETFKQIKEETETMAYETQRFEEGFTFKEIHERTVYIQKKHFNLIKDDIGGRIGELKNTLIRNLQDFAENVGARYISELANNARIKEEELYAVKEAKVNAEKTKTIIKELSAKSSRIVSAKNKAIKIKGGILKYVQRKNKI